MGSHVRHWFRPAAHLVALVLGLFLTTACGGYAADYGITGSAPLGTLAGYDAALESKVQSTAEFDEERTEKFVGQYDGLTYVEGLVAKKYDVTGEWLVAIHDDDGNVKAVVSNFRSQVAGFSTQGKLIESYSCKLWLEISGSEATFVATHYDKRTAEQYYLAQFGAGRRGGEWRKEASGGNLAAVLSIVDTMWIWSQ